MVLGKERRDQTFSLTGLSPSLARLSRPVQLRSDLVTLWFYPGRTSLFPLPLKSNTQGLSHSLGLGSSLFARRYSGNRISFFSSGYLDGSVPPVSLPYGILEVHSSGLPHSGISGSQLAYSYPKLIAVGHALLRLLAPRHPPYALFNLTAKPLIIINEIC